MGKRRSEHDPNETTPCESCEIDLLIMKRAHELTAEQGHAKNIMESLKQEVELEAMFQRCARSPRRKKQ